MSAKATLQVSWVQGLQFVGTDGKGHSVVMDLPESSGGQNSSCTPSDLFLMALGGCTAVDVVEILRKGRQRVTGVEVQVSGERNEDFPKYFRRIHLKYLVRGEGLKDDRVGRAIELSEEKYCSVGATIKRGAEIGTSFEVLNE